MRDRWAFPSECCIVGIILARPVASGLGSRVVITLAALVTEGVPLGGGKVEGMVRGVPTGLPCFSGGSDCFWMNATGVSFSGTFVSALILVIAEYFLTSHQAL